MSLRVRRAWLLRHLQIINNSIKLSNIYIYFLEKSAASYQGLISKTLISQLHSVAECDQDIAQQFESENLKCDRLILKREIQHINKRAQQPFHILTKKSFCSYKSMWRVCQVAPPVGPAALLSYSSRLYNTQVIDKRLYRHVELIQSFLMGTDQITNNCFCFYLPALHCCSLISLVFLRREATTAL